MFDRRNITYIYDGTFEGLMSAVYRTFRLCEIPQNIQCGENAQQSFETVYFHVETTPEMSSQMQNVIIDRACIKAMRKIFLCYLANTEYREMKILTYIHRCFKYGKNVNSHLNDKYVAAVLNAAQSVVSEAHNLKGFVRFSELSGGVMYSEISPKNRVLTCLAKHFTERFPNTAFMINDLTHKECLVYNGNISIKSTESLVPTLNYSGDEEEYRKLWREFYDTVEIKERHNEKCRMTHMPKRYWKHLTEMT